ncbi:hypothetical protein BU198_13480 [Streptomyces sp. CBMA156]|nr:hypothetical protein [Streptomyces sp. CBMA156]
MTRLAAAKDSAPDSRQGAARRKTRTPRARTPEPKEIVSGAGQPLDPGVRRELEARLGHDLSRVRVHTDRDSAALTELIGADAVAVGPDLFFGEGRYRPAAEDGRRLLTHELLHTVQAPNPLGALRAGRDLGAVSLPQDAIEREAEQGARADRPTATPGATPGWLRYATVDADRFRTERLDPATLVDRLAAGILRSLRGDPTDSSGRVRLQLARFAPELQDSVLGRLEDRLPSSDYTRVLELVEAAEHRPADGDGAQTPEPVTGAAERAEDEREQGDRRGRRQRDAHAEVGGERGPGDVVAQHQEEQQGEHAAEGGGERDLAGDQRPDPAGAGPGGVEAGDPLGPPGGHRAGGDGREPGDGGERGQAPEQPGQRVGAAGRVAHRPAEGAQQEGGDHGGGQGGEQPAAEVGHPVAPGQTEIEHVDSFAARRGQRWLAVTADAAAVPRPAVPRGTGAAGAVSRPSTRATARSANRTSSGSWVARTRVSWWDRAALVSIRMTWSEASRCSGAVGSSAKTTGGSGARARATATRWRWLWSSRSGRCRAQSPTSRRSSHSAAAV